MQPDGFTLTIRQVRRLYLAFQLRKKLLPCRLALHEGFPAAGSRRLVQT